MASQTRDLIEDLVDFEAASGNDLPEEPTQQPPTNDGDEGLSPPVASSIPPVPAVYADAITPSQWAGFSRGLRAGMIAKAPLTVRKVHALDAEAIVLQHRLEDEASRDAIRADTDRRNQSVSRHASLEETKA